jgi:hypothetical protein
LIVVSVSADVVLCLWVAFLHLFILRSNLWRHWQLLTYPNNLKILKKPTNRLLTAS